jgi:phosphoribosylformimino-5-aminoimidazole carboxamide ribotide isomerase
MILFPAIDLLGGRVVRLRRGDRHQVDVYSDDPVAVARDFAERGATWIHVVDLSAAFGEDEDSRAANARALAGICAVPGVQVDTGGGVRSLERIDELASLGVRRVALGTAIVRDRAFAAAAAERFGDLLTADVAARDGRVKVAGWEQDAAVEADALVGELASLGFKHLVFTDIARDGMQTGVNAAAYAHIAQVAGFPVVASGGIATLADLQALAALGPDAVEGAITGRALYEGAFTLEDALAASAASASAAADPKEA